ncbi:hypothetical protein ABVT39_010500 [Epinephelus coioides]
MAEPWRTPPPYQENQGDQPVFLCQQQGSYMLGRPRLPHLPPPSAPFHTGSPYPMANLPTPTCTSSEGALMEGRGRTYQMVLTQPPAEDLLRFMLQGPDVPSPSRTHQEPLTNSSNPGGQAQADPSQEGSWGNVNPSLSASQYLRQMQASTEAQKSTAVQAPTPQEHIQHSAHADMQPVHSPDSSSSSEEGNDLQSCGYSPTTPEPVDLQTDRHVRRADDGHLPVQALQHDVCTTLEVEYGVYPEILEGYLWQLPDGEPKCTMHRNIVKNLRTQLHLVPQDPYRLLVCSLLIILWKRLCRIHRETYTIRKAESRRLSREHMELTDQEILNLCTQVRELTQAKDALQQEVVMLRDRVASYRHLRMGGTSSYVSDGQQLYGNTG